MIAHLAPLLAVWLWASPAAAQYRFDHWTADNGLPQNSVREILQTQDGYLWVTTFDGLVRFDGVRFTVFNKSNSPGLPSNRFVGLFEDSVGDLWASLETGGVVRRHEGHFTSYTEAQGLPGDALVTLSDDGQGNVVAHDQQVKYEGAENALAGVTARAYRFREGRFEPAGELSYAFSFQPPLDVGTIASAANMRIIEGDFWICADRQIIRLLKSGGKRVYNERNGLPGAQPALIWGKRQPLQIISRDAAGRLWLTDLTSMQSRPFTLQAPALGASAISFYNGYADNEGNYWFGTNGNGLFRARRQTVTAYGRTQGLAGSEIYPLLEGRDGSLWIGSYLEGVSRLKDGAFTQYVGSDLYLRYVNSLYEDRAGQVWINGFWRLVAGRLVNAPWAPTVPELSFQMCQTMCEDGEGAYWVGAYDGVARHLGGVSTYYTTKDGLAGNDTKVIVDDGRGGLWLGSYGGLTHYEDGRFTAWTEKDGLAGSTVRALKRDEDGTLWIGTYDSGLGRFKDGRFTTYTTKNGLFDNGVFQILEDDFGWMWMSCNRGIYRVRKQELTEFAEGKVGTITCLAYNKSDGMPSSECNGGRWPAGVKTRDGRLWFPTMDGVAMIDPASIETKMQPPPVVIEAMRINNEPAPFDAWDSALRDPQTAIEIGPEKDNFEIEYTALSFINSENMRFRYKLEGADHDWVEAGTRRTAYFSHLAPGEYTFRVIAANSDGVWNETGASVRITVVPPFWRTWWFLGLSALAVAAAIAGIWKYRVGQLERIQMAQQAFARQLIASQETERKRIAGELHDSLGQSLVIIRNWAMLGASQLGNGAPAREELDEINDIASRTINEVREIAYNLGPYHLERLGFEKSIRDMVKRVAQASGIRITAELDTLDGALSRDTELSLYRIAQEALNNMVKHSNAAETRVSLKRESAGVRLIVTDDGRGFDPQAAASPDHAGKPGFGLNGMAERVRLLGGTLSIRSAPGKGTTVETLLPGAPGTGNGTGK